MKEAVFIINNRFTADSTRNEVFDKETGQKNRLEPRLMKLLCILAENEGKIVKREFIVKEIWDDYPGANEGLNQAISFLRKVLDDENKEIIRTQPKAGYIFHAVILWERENVPGKKRNYIPAIITAAALLLILFYAKKDAPKNTAKELGERDAAGMARKDSIHQAEQMRYSKDTLGHAAMERKEKIDAAIGRQDSIHQAERMRQLKSK